MLSPSGDPLTLWPFPARREDLETLFPDQAEIEDPLREWRRNSGRQNTGDGGLEAKDRGPPPSNRWVWSALLYFPAGILA